MSKYWLHRISWEWQVSYPLLDNGYLSIGWSDFGTEELLRKLREDFEGTIAREWGCYSKSRFFLWNFISRMNYNDIVIVPKPSTFDIYRIIGNQVITAEELCRDKKLLAKINKKLIWNKGHLYLGEKVVDLGFFWKLEKMATGLRRSDFESLSDKMKFLGTNLQLNDVAKSIENIRTRISEGNVKRNEFGLKEGQLISERINKEIGERTQDLLVWYFQSVGANAVCKQVENNRLKADVVAMFDNKMISITVKVYNDRRDLIRHSAKYINDFKKTEEFRYSRLWIILPSDEIPEEQKSKETDKIWLIGKTEFIEMLSDREVNRVEKY